MARLPRTQRSTQVSGSRFRQGGGVNGIGAETMVTPGAVEQTGGGWGLLADATAAIEGIVRPMAMDLQREAGRASVIRDEAGDLVVDEKSMLGGEWAEAHNGAAYAKYLAQSRIDLRSDLGELRQKHKFDPGAFKDSSDELIKRVYGKAPAPLRDNIRAQAENEQGAIFDGMRASMIARDEGEADRGSLAARKMASQDYVSMIQNGVAIDDPRAIAKMAEIDEITRFRGNAGYINESQAEGEAFNKALMGDAKAMRLQREIDELGGTENLSDKDRDRLTSAIRDPDISPTTQEQLRRLLNGEIKRIDGTSFARSLTSDDHWSVLERNERGGTSDGVPRDPSTGVPRSSASGRYGLLDGTFYEMVLAQRRQGKADWSLGMSKEEVLKSKGDPVRERAAAETYRAQLQTVLAKEGLPINSGNEYVMWVLGEGGGAKALKADPTTPAVDVVGSAAVDANPELMKGKTIGDVITSLRRKGGGPKSSDITGIQAEINTIEDPEVRRVAQAEANRWYSQQRTAEAEAAERYGIRIASGDSVTRDEILSDPELDDGAQRTLIRSITAAEKATAEVSDMIASINDPESFVNMSDTKTRNSVDKAYIAMSGGADPLSNEGMAAAAHIMENTGALPKTMVGALTGAMSSGDPERMVAAMNFGEQALRTSPGALSVYGKDGKKLSQDIAEYRHEIKMGRGAQGAAQKMAERRLPENVEKRKNRVGEAKKASEALTPDDLTGIFDEDLAVIGLAFDDPTLNPVSRDAMMSMLRRETENQFVESGDPDVAKARALDEVKRTFGVTHASGSPVVMVHPPERHYPTVNGDHDWLYNQLRNDVINEVSAAQRESGKLGKGAFNVIPRENIHMQSDPETQADIEAGRPPSYVVWYRDGDKLDRVPERWHADPSEVEAERDAENAEFEAGAASGRDAGMEAAAEVGVALFDFAEDTSKTASQLVDEVHKRGAEVIADVEKEGMKAARRGRDRNTASDFFADFKQQGTAAMAAPGRKAASDAALNAGISIYDAISGASESEIQAAVDEADNNIREFLKILGVKGF